MQKPMTVAKREFLEAVVEAVNNAGLPFFVVRQVLEELLKAVCQGEEAQEEKDRAEYEKYLREKAAQEAADHAGEEVKETEVITHGTQNNKGDDTGSEGSRAGL